MLEDLESAVMPPRPGHFVLYDSATPALTAGRYVVNANVDLHPGSGKTLAVDDLNTNVEVTAPRFSLPSSELLSTFPPANAVGAFHERLPQVVLKQRTLPWVREPDPDHNPIDPSGTPWLALVVLAETEAQWHNDRPVAECTSAELSGRNDVATGSCVVVSQNVIDRVFPTVEDLPLLAHVRQVDVADTELALGDDDGFLAVVMANRLPQFNTETNEPVAYRACLISVEGQLDVLPEPTTPVSTFDLVTEVEVLGDVVAAAINSLPAGDRGGILDNRSAAGGSSVATSGSTGSASVAGITATQAAGVDLASGFVQDALAGKLTFKTFPVLAQWRFTSAASGSFERLMQNLDVGLLGTEPEPSDLPGGRRVEVTETGHVSLAHLTRRGEEVSAWFRGPLTPHRITRESPGDPLPGEAARRLPLAHTSDQLRAVTPEGTEDLSRASGFEIGRLVALSNPAVVAAMMRWRRDQFGAAKQELQNNVFTDATGLNLGKDFGEVAGQLVTIYDDPPSSFPPYRPPVTPGRPVLDFIPDELTEWDDVVASGFGFEEPLLASLALSDGVDEAQLAGVAEAVAAAKLSTLAEAPVNFAGLESAAIGEIVRGIASVAENQERLAASFDALDGLDTEVPAVFAAVRGSDISIEADAGQILTGGGVIDDGDADGDADGDGIGKGLLGGGVVLGGISDVIVLDDAVLDGGLLGGGLLDGPVLDADDVVLDLTDPSAIGRDGRRGGTPGGGS